MRKEIYIFAPWTGFSVMNPPYSLKNRIGEIRIPRYKVVIPNPKIALSIFSVSDPKTL